MTASISWRRFVAILVMVAVTLLTVHRCPDGWSDPASRAGAAHTADH